MAKKIDVNGLGHYHDKVSAMLASEYSSSKTYAVGDYCFHAGTLYECTTAITTAENWTAGHWTAAKLAEDTSALKTAVTQKTDALYSNLYSNYPLYLQLGEWENGTIDASGNLVNEQRKDYARTKNYFISQSDIKVILTRKTAMGSGSICYLEYNPTTYALVSRIVFAAADGTEKEITIKANTPYKFFFTTPSGTVVDLSNTNTYATFEGKTLTDRIGYEQLQPSFKSLFYQLKDLFGNANFGNPTGMTVTKSSNEISLTSTANSSYVPLTYTFLKDHNYLIYYDIQGTLTGTGYEFEFRFMRSGVTATIAKFPVYSDSASQGHIIGTPTVNTTLYLLSPNSTGQVITGSIYVYDVTGVSSGQIDSIDWANVGNEQYIILAYSSNKWYGKKVVFYGDSITQTSYPEMVQGVLRFDLVKKAIIGTRFGYAADSDSFSDDTRIESVPSDADVVCIMGGTNDWQWTEIESGALTYSSGFDRTKFKGAVAYTIQKMQARCPDAQIYLLTNIGGRGDEDPTVVQPLPMEAPSGAGIGNTPLKIRDATIEVANTLNIPVIDTWSCGINGFNRSKYIADTVHPNSAGQTLIAQYVTEALINAAPW